MEKKQVMKKKNLINMEIQLGNYLYDYYYIENDFL